MRVQFISRNDVISQRLKSFCILGGKKIALFFNFPVSRARPEKLCAFYRLQLRITCKSGWIAQAEKSYLVSKEGKSKLTALIRTKTQGVCSNGARLGLGRLKILSRTLSRATCWCWFLDLRSKRLECLKLITCEIVARSVASRTKKNAPLARKLLRSTCV